MVDKIGATIDTDADRKMFNLKKAYLLTTSRRYSVESESKIFCKSYNPFRTGNLLIYPAEENLNDFEVSYEQNSIM